MGVSWFASTAMLRWRHVAINPTLSSGAREGTDRRRGDVEVRALLPSPTVGPHSRVGPRRPSQPSERSTLHFANAFARVKLADLANALETTGKILVLGQGMSKAHLDRRSDVEIGPLDLVVVIAIDH